MSATETATEAPPVGTLFTHRDARYRVEGYLRPYTPPPVDESDPMAVMVAEMMAELNAEADAEHLAQYGRPRPQGHGPDDCRLEFCLRSEAVYVHGYGVCGTIVRVADVVPEGMIDWPAEVIAGHAADVERIAGQRLW
jgi:hypothetical protein